MISKNETAVREQNGKTTLKKVEAQKQLSIAKKADSVEELQKKIKDLESKLSAIPSDLEKRIEYFNGKKELIRRLSKLDVDSEALNRHLDQLAELAAEDEFTNSEYQLNIESGSGYGKNTVFTLKNPVIIGDLINFLLGRINKKREELQKAIEA